MRRLAIPALPALELALFGLALAGAAVVATLRHMLQSPPTPARTSGMIAVPSIRRLSDDRARGADIVLADDPFFPGRTPPASRYRLAGGDVAAARHDARAPVVLGTVVAANGSSFAVCRVSNEPSRTVRVGGTIDGYRLTAVERGRALFTTPEGRSLAVESNTSSRPAVAGPSRAGQPRAPVQGSGQPSADTLGSED